MKIMHNLTFTLIALFAAPIIAIETPPLPELPPELIWHLIPFVAETNTVRVIETIHSINATSRFFHDAIHSETVMLELLKRIPHTANAVYIAQNNKIAQKHSRSWQSTHFRQWLSNCSLKSGFEFYQAVVSNNYQLIDEYLKRKSINLYEHCHPLMLACNNLPLLKTFLTEGVYPEKITLETAIANKAEGAVACLLEAGANPFISLPEFECSQTNGCLVSVYIMAEIRQLVLNAQAKRRQRLLELQGKADKLVTTSQPTRPVLERNCIAS